MGRLNQEEGKAQPRKLPGISKCIYFSDPEALATLEGILAKYPRASFSAIMAQVTKPLILALKDLPPTERQVEFKLRIWI